MTVLLTHERFLPDFGGGGEEIVFQTASHLRDRGARVRVLTTGDPAITEYRGIPTDRLPVSRYRINFAAGAISRAAAGFDLIHTFNYHACLPSWLAARRLGKPVVCTVLGLFRDAWRDMRGPLLGRCFAAWERLLVRLPYTRTLFLSEYSRGQALACGVPESRALVNTPGIDPAFFAASAPKDGSVLFAGKFEERKGVGDVLAVARALPAVRFRLAGWGPEEAAIRAAALPNVEMLGFLQAGELAQAYARASVFLFPSRA
ncbi:MAG: glycosyltransferase family 4 protein, partial [Acidobacteriota bacterium]|nr:glycosyltransferase family 4 protein [Acidobacteriota bacterium]